MGLDHFDDHKAFMEYSNDIQDVSKNIEDYNPGKEHKILKFFDDMIADMINNKKLNPIVTELFIRVTNKLINNLISLLSLLRNLILKCQKTLD